jgi:hypothetical protein
MQSAAHLEGEDVRARIELQRSPKARQRLVPISLTALDRPDDPQELAVVRLALAGRAELLQGPLVIQVPPVVEVAEGDAGLGEVGVERERAVHRLAGQLQLLVGAIEEVVEHAASLCELRVRQREVWVQCDRPLVHFDRAPGALLHE